MGEQTGVLGWDQLGKEVETGKLRAKGISGVGKKGFGEWRVGEEKPKAELEDLEEMGPVEKPL